MNETQLDVNGDVPSWVQVNSQSEIESHAAAGIVAPFPPAPLMHRVSGLDETRWFAKHGCDIFAALSEASPKPLRDFDNILDFGVGCGRLARMFKGFAGSYVGADVDHELLEWVSANLPWVTTVATEPRQRLPFRRRQFDCVISISVFTHMNEADCLFYLSELHRVTRPSAWLFLTVHGTRARERAEREPEIFNVLEISKEALAGEALNSKGFLFVRQDTGHLTSEAYDYGITFMTETYIRSHWSRLFFVRAILTGQIHDFQDVIVLQRANKPWLQTFG